MSNNTLDKNLQAKEWCCPHAFIRLMTRPGDSISKIAKTAGVCPATIKNHRKKFREGNLPCMERSTCLRALWLLPKARAQQDKERRLRDDSQGSK